MAYKGPGHQTQTYLSDHSSPVPTSQAAFQPHPPSDDLFPDCPLCLPPSFPSFCLANSSAEMFPYILSGSHKLCYVFLLHSCSPSTPCIPEPSWSLVVARYSSVSLRLSGSQPRVQPGVSCCSALSHQHQAWGLACTSSPIIPISLGWTELNSGQEEKGHPTQGSRLAKTRKLERVLRVSEMGSSLEWPNVGEEPARSWSEALTAKLGRRDFILISL